MKVVVAPDKFAGTLSARAVAEALAEGWTSVRAADEMAVVPMADGGEGTLDVVAEAVPDAERWFTEVADARGRATEAAWLRLPDGRAFVEAAQACGLSALSTEERNPRATTSYGVGQLLAAADAAEVVEIIVGLGGTATLDGGGGLATALGYRLRRADGNGVKIGGEHLRELTRIDPVAPPVAHVLGAVDVVAPLLGSDGAAAVYGPQKGASVDDIRALEEALATLADVAERDLPGGPWREMPGAGAAGGLGFGLAAFCGARLASGAEVVAALCGLDAALRDADVVLTGEGRLDAQTFGGKTPAFVAQRARAAGAQVLAVAGQVVDGAERGFDDALDLGPTGPDEPVDLLRARAAELARRCRDTPS